MRKLNLDKEFEKREPWVTKFIIDGEEYGGTFDPSDDPRVRRFFEWFPNAGEILELGSLEGGHTFQLGRHAGVRRVVAIEARPVNLEKAMFVQRLLGMSNIKFVSANLETIDLATFGRFDAVFCSGLLYHLPEPWNLVNQFSKVSENLFIWTHYADENQANEAVHGYQGKVYEEAGFSDPLSGLSKRSFWPTLGSLIKMLTINGYHTIHILENNLAHPHVQPHPRPTRSPAVMLAVTSS